MKRIIYKSIVLFSILFSTSYSQEYLEPEDGMSKFDIVSNYHVDVQKVLLKDLDSQPLFRMISLPSFSPEWVVEIVKNDTLGTSIVAVTSEEQIWYSNHMTSDKQLLKPESIKIKYSKIEIDSQYAFQIYEIIQKMLTNTRYFDKDYIKLDGVSFHFSSWKRGVGFRYGQINSPDKITFAYKLTMLGYILYNYTNDNDKLKFTQEIQDLINKFWE